jgi:hypothetical protein
MLTRGAPRGARRLGAVVAALVLAALPIADAFGVEATLPEEALYRRLVVLGEVDAAREGFAELVATRLAALPTPDPGAAPSDDLVGRRAGLVDSAARALRLWETGEVRLRSGGQPTPEAVLERIAAALDALAAAASGIERGVATADSPAAARVRQTNAHVGELFLLSVAFFRDTKLAKRRPDLLATARRHVRVPATLAALDAAQPSAREAFGFGPAPGASAARAPTPAALRPLRDDERSLEDLVRRYCHAFVAGDLRTLKPLFLPGRLPKRAVAREAAKFAGWQLTAVDVIQVRDLGPDELEVTVGRIALVGPGGETRTTRDRLIVRRTASGAYRIARLGGES